MLVDGDGCGCCGDGGCDGSGLHGVIFGGMVQPSAEGAERDQRRDGDAGQAAATFGEWGDQVGTCAAFGEVFGGVQGLLPTLIGGGHREQDAAAGGGRKFHSAERKREVEPEPGAGAGEPGGDGGGGGLRCRREFVGAEAFAVIEQ